MVASLLQDNSLVLSMNANPRTQSEWPLKVDKHFPSISQRLIDLSAEPVKIISSKEQTAQTAAVCPFNNLFTLSFFQMWAVWSQDPLKSKPLWLSLLRAQTVKGNQRTKNETKI